jgi:hypothetical protein
MIKTILTTILLIALGLGGIFGLNYFGYLNIAFFAPKYEGVRRDVMIESRYYSEASVRRLYDLKRQYETAKTSEEKDTVAAAARHEFSIFPEDRLPQDLRGWMRTIK